MDHEPVGMHVRENLTKLLRRPVSRGMLGDTAVQDAPRADLHRDKHVENLEPRGD
jgi:hypothetical protein